jgi:hypothetical protein
MANDNQYGFYRDIQLNNGAMVVSVEGGSGTSGTSGINGTSGSSGASGTNGTSGTSGTGTSGTSGVSGTNGTSGTSPSGGGSIAGSHFNYALASNRTYNLATGGVYEQTGIEASAIWCFPFRPGQNIDIKALSMDIFTSNATGQIKLLLYSDKTGFGIPDQLLIESTAISVATTGIKQYNVSYTLSAGTTYWLGVAANSTGNVQCRGISQYNAFPFGCPSNTGTSTIYTLARSYTLTWPTIPTTFTLNDLQSARIQEVRFITL